MQHSSKLPTIAIASSSATTVVSTVSNPPLNLVLMADREIKSAPPSRLTSGADSFAPSSLGHDVAGASVGNGIFSNDEENLLDDENVAKGDNDDDDNDDDDDVDDDEATYGWADQSFGYDDSFASSSVGGRCGGANTSNTTTRGAGVSGRWDASVGEDSELWRSVDGRDSMTPQARSPGDALRLHQKLSSPSRKPPVEVCDNEHCCG